MTRPALDHPVFDADNHYYEALDAFTRHLDPKVAHRTVQWAEIDGRRYHLVAGRVSHAVTNPTFNPIAKPGALYHYLRGNPDGDEVRALMRAREPIPAHYLEPEARIEVMDRQGLEAIWLFPTLGVLYEELLKHDPEAVTLTFRSFNQWLDEDWGLAHRDRIFAAPYITLADVDWAVRELEWALDRGARLICMRPAAAWTTQGPRSPGDPHFDPFWARVNEAGITVAVHAGDSGYTCHGYARDGFSANFGGGGMGGRPSIKAWNIERAALDFLATLIFDRLFERFPAVRVASVENGSEFLPDLVRKLRSMGRRTGRYFQQDPLETFRRHVWINPFWEDDVKEVVEYMGPERVIFGSDWPHIEGVPDPLDYLVELESFDADTRRRILRENARELNELRPA
ncbi:MAG: amidohydrolase family protein [Myxococcales bacterium]|nr:amidohydrolase family protein [Myxococcales bacterium]